MFIDLYGHKSALFGMCTYHIYKFESFWPTLTPSFLCHTPNPYTLYRPSIKVDMAIHTFPTSCALNKFRCIKTLTGGQLTTPRIGPAESVLYLCINQSAILHDIIYKYSLRQLKVIVDKLVALFSRRVLKAPPANPRTYIYW